MLDEEIPSLWYCNRISAWSLELIKLITGDMAKYKK
jgi:hypothetical protein